MAPAWAANPGALEVRSDPALPHLWHEARLEDVVQGAVVCSFDDGVWPEASFGAADVRPAGRASEARPLRTGDPAELQVPRTVAAPDGWCTGRIEAVQGDLLLFAPRGRGPDGGRAAEIVPRSRLRPCAAEPPGGLDELLRRVRVPVEPELQDWLSGMEAASCLDGVERAAHGVAAAEGSVADANEPQLLRVRPSGKGQASILVVGTADAVEKATAFVQAALRHQLHVRRCADAVRLRAAALERRKQQQQQQGPGAGGLGEHKFMKEFETDSVMASRIIGKGGLRVQQLQAEYNVKIKVLAAKKEDSRIVRVSGSDEARVRKAFEDTAVLCETMPLEPHMQSFAAGDGYKTLSRLQKAAGLHSCRIEQDPKQLVFQGTQQACAHARELYKAHLLYYDVFHDLGERKTDLALQLQDTRGGAPGPAPPAQQQPIGAQPAPPRKGGGRGARLERAP